MTPSTPSSEAQRPLRRDAERNRQRILQAAGEVFATRGLSATMDDIAHHAGVGVGTVYRRFPDKELLIDALFEERIGMLVGVAEEGLAEPDPWDGLVLFLERGVAEQACDRGLKELLLGTLHGRDRVERMRARLKPLVDELIARAKAAGALRADFEGTDMAVIHLMLGAAVDFTEDVKPETWRRYLQLVLDGLRMDQHGPTPPAQSALDEDELDHAMRNWPGGGRRTPRDS
jgi:AcrR family transcriptional regulator